MTQNPSNRFKTRMKDLQLNNMMDQNKDNVVTYGCNRGGGHSTIRTFAYLYLMHLCNLHHIMMNK